MTYLYNRSELKKWRRRLRRNQTDAETRLWHCLRNRRFDGLKFFRQYSVGPYALDFYCPKRRLAIELDGAYHDAPEQISHDERRTEYLAGFSIRVLRFKNEEVVEDVDRVLALISAAARVNSPQPPL